MHPHIATGKEVFLADPCMADMQLEIAAEQQRYNGFLKKHFPNLMQWTRELIWLFGKWKTPALNSFVDNFKTDVLFFPVYPVIYMGYLQLYIKKYTSKPSVCYIADDNYTYIPCGWNPLALLHRFFLRRVVKRLIDSSAQILVIAPRQKEEYDRLFHIDSKILTKGIDFSNLSFQNSTPRVPIKMVYTGKLIIGRGDSLVRIADALEKINSDRIHITLDIYTTDKVSAAYQRKLNLNGCRICGALPLEEVQKCQQQADILVFAESLLPRFRYAARLSFSTKLTDYLKSGKCILAIGDRSIAPIDYLIRNDAAVIADSDESIYEQLLHLIENPKLITEYGKKSFECGKRNHDEKQIREFFLNTLKSAKENNYEI